MKILVFIMAVTVLICSVIPCREFAFSVKGNDQAFILNSANQQDHNDTDNCSPFCSCNCCCSFTFMFTAYQVVPPVAKFNPKHDLHFPSKIFDTSLPVWQPPQLV